MHSYIYHSFDRISNCRTISNIRRQQRNRTVPHRQQAATTQQGATARAKGLPDSYWTTTARTAQTASSYVQTASSYSKAQGAPATGLPQPQPQQSSYCTARGSLTATGLPTDQLCTGQPSTAPHRQQAATAKPKGLQLLDYRLTSCAQPQQAATAGTQQGHSKQLQLRLQLYRFRKQLQLLVREQGCDSTQRTGGWVWPRLRAPRISMRTRSAMSPRRRGSTSWSAAAPPGASPGPAGRRVHALNQRPSRSRSYGPSSKCRRQTPWRPTTSFRF
eukprot:COSAG02_NODE_475_length_21552_cov_4.236470_20_plen_274_part_00